MRHHRRHALFLLRTPLDGVNEQIDFSIRYQTPVEAHKINNKIDNNAQVS
jgi:hypothetical protein